MPEAEPARGQVETIADLHRASESRVGRHQRLIERLTARVGRPATLYALLGAVLAWCAFNLAAQHPPDPPPFTALQTLVTVASLLVTTMVLITQNRQARQAERRAQLDLHVNLQAEQKIAKLISLVEELRRDLPVRDRKDSEADAMSHAADPQAVLDALEESLDEPDDEPTPPPDETTG